MATVTFYKLSSYNSGNLVPVEINLDNIDSYEKFMEELKEKIKAVGGEEWIVADFEDIPEQYVTEYDLSPDYFDYKEAVEKFGEEVTQAALALDIPLDEIEENYCGCFEGLTEDEALGNYAYYLAEECGELDQIPDRYKIYIDWEEIGRDMGLNGDAGCP